MKNPDATQEKLRNIFRVAPTGIGSVKNRVIQEVNPRVCEMTGYSEEELIGQSARLLYPTDEEFNYVGSEKYDQIARQGTGIVETRWQRKDGSIINVLLASTPIDTSDLSQGVAFTALDYTERKQMQDALKESERKLKEELEIQMNVKTQELQKRVLELERLQEATIEREFRIKELRDEIERLKGEKP